MNDFMCAPGLAWSPRSEIQRGYGTKVIKGVLQASRQTQSKFLLKEKIFLRCLHIGATHMKSPCKF